MKALLRQNRIDYITLGNPEGVSELLYDYGYEPPENPQELVLATKELIQRKGKKAIKDLIRLHPDRAAILKLEKEANPNDSYCSACKSYNYHGEDNYCGACGHSNYDGENGKATFVQQLADMSKLELEKYYQTVLRKSNLNPGDTNLAEEVELVWNELRKRVREEENTPDKPTSQESKGLLASHQNGLIILGLVFIAGILVGTSIRADKN